MTVTVVKKGNGEAESLQTNAGTFTEKMLCNPNKKEGKQNHEKPTPPNGRISPNKKISGRT